MSTATRKKGPKGDQGVSGAPGASGASATIEVGTVTTTAFGNPAQVVNVGSPEAAIFNFVIPQGAAGSGYRIEEFKLTQAQVDAKGVTISYAPLSGTKVRVSIQYGPDQWQNIDFKVEGNVVSWDQLAMDSLVDVDTLLAVEYFT